MDKESEIYNFYLRTKGGLGIIKGKSMYPTLREGWKIKVDPADENKIRVGDIVLFSKESLICHRIIGKIRFFGRTYFIHKGDNSSNGGIFEAKDLVGKVLEIFDEKRRKIVNLGCPKSYFNNIKFLGYLYLVMYLIKRKIWAEDTIG